MYYNHHRYYMPGLGRYNRVDILKHSFACAFYYLPLININSYLYTNNNAIINYDSSGLLTIPIPIPPGGPEIGGRDCTTSVCTYYDNNCSSTQCTYHCHVGYFCRNLLPGDPNSTKSKCIRCCLIDEDEVCINEANRNCERCPSYRCEISAHIRCFSKC